MATHKVSLISSRAQFPVGNKVDTCEITHESFCPPHGCSLYMAIIQKSVRKWEKPYLHQRAIVLFANSPEETKLRLQLEDRMRLGEQVLQIIEVGE